MGLHNLAKFMIEKFSGKETEFDWRDSDVAPWLVIDYNNLIMSLVNESGGHIALLKERLEDLYGALVISKARICIVKDGKFNSDERSVIKLGRMHNKIEQGTVERILYSSCDCNLAYAIFDQTFLSLGEEVCNDIKDENHGTRYIVHKANGEADDVIRDFARRKLNEKCTVLIISQDTSLILGLDPTENLSLVRFEKLRLTVGEVKEGGRKVRDKTYILSGPTYCLKSVLEKLDQETNLFFRSLYSTKEMQLWRTSTGLATSVTCEMLLYIGALLDDETGTIRRGQYDDPYTLLIYLRDTFVHDSVTNENVMLYVAVAFIRGWSETKKSDETFLRFINDVTANAKLTSDGDTYTLYGLKSRFKTGQIARKFLFRTKKIHLVLKGVQKDFKYAEDDHEYAGSYNKSTQIITYSKENEVRDNCPGGYGNEKVREAVHKEVMKRYERYKNYTSVNYISLKRYITTTYEVDDEDTATIMEPLNTLRDEISNIYYITTGNLVSNNEKVRERDQKVGNIATSLYCTVPSPLTTKFPFDSDIIIDKNVVSETSVSDTSVLKMSASETIVSDVSVLKMSASETIVSDTSVKKVYMKTRLTSPESVDNLLECTLLQLLACVRGGGNFPSEGYISVKSSTSSKKLHFYTDNSSHFQNASSSVSLATAKFLGAVKFAPLSGATLFDADDTNTAVDDTYAAVNCCTGETVLTTATHGTSKTEIFMVYKTDTEIVIGAEADIESNSGPLTGTVSGYHETPTGTGPLTGTVSGYETRAEHKMLRIFEYLGISTRTFRPIDNDSNLSEYTTPEYVMKALRAVKECWSKLESKFSCKNLNLNSSFRTAEVVYSMIYIFRLLVSKNRGEILNDELLFRISLSLIICPIYSIHTPENNYLPQTFLSDKVKKEGLPNKNLTSTLYSEEINAYNKQFFSIDTVYDKKLLRECSLLDCILSSILYDNFLGVEKLDWINYCTWYNLCGLQHVMLLLHASDIKIGTPVSDLITILEGNKTSPPLELFIESAITAAEAVVTALKK